MYSQLVVQYYYVWLMLPLLLPIQISAKKKLPNIASNDLGTRIFMRMKFWKLSNSLTVIIIIIIITVYGKITILCIIRFDGVSFYTNRMKGIKRQDKRARNNTLKFVKSQFIFL